MGCHTWIYEKVDNIPSEVVMFKYFFRTTYEDGKDKWGTWEMKDSLIDALWADTHYKNSKNKDIQRIMSYGKVPNEIKHLAYPNEMFFEIPEADFSLLFDETGLYKECGYHDIFRVYGYPDVRLHSYKECESFLNSEKVVEPNSRKGEGFYELGQSKTETLTTCKKFYDSHPNALITFG